MKILLKYFLRGFLIIAPVSLTVYIVIGLLNWLDELFYISIPGLGLLLVVMLLTVLGFLGSSLLVKPFLVLSERALHRLPLVSIIYSSIKDLFDAFVGENQNFKQAVLVRLQEEPAIYKIGFITQESLQALQLPEHVAVYVPFSYDFSGEMFLVPRQNVQVLDMPSTTAMKFAVSGGVSRI